MAAMDLDEAMRVLGIEAGASTEEVRLIYLRLVREHHPDAVTPSALTLESRTLITARVTSAYATVTQAMRESGSTRVPPPRPATTEPPEATPTTGATTRSRRPAVTELDDADVIAVGAGPAETYALLYEAASHVGNIAYYDRQLGILEIIVRFEGGPSCSVLMTLRRHAGRRDQTAIVCEMESIEAAPTPPIRPVVEELVVALRGRH